jgi:acyl-coenzyme A synthetase/AMP-(fatty) acid ligase
VLPRQLAVSGFINHFISVKLGRTHNLLMQLLHRREGNDYGHERTMTYQQVLTDTCRLANWLCLVSSNI